MPKQAFVWPIRPDTELNLHRQHQYGRAMEAAKAARKREAEASIRFSHTGIDSMSIIHERMLANFHKARLKSTKAAATQKRAESLQKKKRQPRQWSPEPDASVHEAFKKLQPLLGVRSSALVHEDMEQQRKPETHVATSEEHGTISVQSERQLHAEVLEVRCNSSVENRNWIQILHVVVYVNAK
jgi:hypothetical protein